jgi:hypothetical protein
VCRARVAVGYAARADFRNSAAAIFRSLTKRAYSRALRTFAEHGLGHVFPERTGAAGDSFFAQGFEAEGGSRHGIFRLLLEDIIAAAGGSIRKPARVPFYPIGVTYEKHSCQSWLTPLPLLALY